VTTTWTGSVDIVNDNAGFLGAGWSLANYERIYSVTGRVSGYFSGCNERLLHTVPATARHILDIGCGEGNLGVALKKRNRDCTVWGIESDADAARKAAERLDKVFRVDVQDADLPIETGSLDCVLPVPGVADTNQQTRPGR
jgi:SAM-dependent methyltransferase